MKKDLSNIIEHYGPTHQLKKLSEEVFELQEAVLEYHHEEYKYYPEIEKKTKRTYCRRNCRCNGTFKSIYTPLRNRRNRYIKSNEI